MRAPSVLITFINMILQGHATVPLGCSEFMFPGQSILQNVCVILAVLCVPVMLLGKPLLFLFQKKRREARVLGNGTPSQDIELQTEGLQNNVAISQATDAHESETFGEVMIHQVIHTIEYVLSTISHTASYLRLWALSLAHGQLSEVLWNMVLRKGLGATEDNYVKSVILFFDIRCMGRIHRRHPCDDGRAIGFPAYPSASLGRVYEQILRWPGLSLSAILFQNYLRCGRIRRLISDHCCDPRQ